MNYSKLFLLSLLVISVNIKSMNDVSRCNYLVEYIHPSIVTAIQSGNVGAVRSALDQFFSKKPISRTVYRNHPKDIFKYAKCIGNVKIIEFLESYLF